MSGGTPTVYEQCGMSIRSALALDLAVSESADADVEVQVGAETTETSDRPLGRIIAGHGDGEVDWYTATATGDGFLIRFPGCGDFVISQDISTVVVRPQRDGRPELLPILLAGTVSAFLLTLRGATVLHASAVMMDGVALAFVGHSGHGKSTMAALMCLAGADLVADDLLAVTPGVTPMCRGGASALRLRAQAAHLADEQPERGQWTTEDHRRAFGARTATYEPHPLGTIVIPSPSRTTSEVRIDAVPPSDAVFALMSMPRIMGWRDTDVIRRNFTVLGHIARGVPVYTATVPWGPPFHTDVATSLVELVAADRAG